jgi:hypothetical protein
MDIKDIIYRISRLTSKEKIHILNILKNKELDFTKNANGYFFNFLNIDDETLDKICNCLELIEGKRDLIKEMDKRRNELMIYYKSIIEDKLQYNLQNKRNEYISKLQIQKCNNISLEFSRIFKIKRKIYDTDPDIALKEIYKSRNKFVKDSVYHRISICLKSKSNRGTDSKKEDHYSEEYNANSEIDIQDNIDIIDDDIIDDVDDIIDDDIIDKNLDFDVEEDDDAFNDTFNENGNDENDDDENDDTIEEQDEYEIAFYKNLLNKQGFVFDDDKKCMLIYQTYVE